MRPGMNCGHAAAGPSLTSIAMALPAMSTRPAGLPTAPRAPVPRKDFTAPSPRASGSLMISPGGMSAAGQGSAAKLQSGKQKPRMAGRKKRAALLILAAPEANEMGEQRALTLHPLA